MILKELLLGTGASLVGHSVLMMLGAPRFTGNPVPLHHQYININVLMGDG